jgi:hypothetical protein
MGGDAIWSKTTNNYVDNVGIITEKYLKTCTKFTIFFVSTFHYIKKKMGYNGPKNPRGTTVVMTQGKP